MRQSVADFRELSGAHDGIENDSAADILEREVQPTIQEWLRRVNLVPGLTSIPLSDADRTGHLPKLFQDLIYRLRLGNAPPPPVSKAAAAMEKFGVRRVLRRHAR